ncbi:YjjW family glycine radical enzyme activase [Alkalithermobacter paradoxus]|uniref:Pyruvate formate-lyase 1-activating enzyme n=1 Tax=Alkalithermobacter paradoxus TaxID=29349 RepID=A0A1V4IBH4_9FIRM|nr:pyruvate formate-lyase 1-activating enzyme [[Clostridium] thermoalcaliphilum]
MCSALVNKIIHFSSVDGPGNRMAIFLQGCNFDCLYCHNPETINTCSHCKVCSRECESNAISIIKDKIVWNKTLCKDCDKCVVTCTKNSSPKTIQMSVEDILKEIKRIKPFISGITVSGGECTLQSNFVTKLFKEVKNIGLSTFLDTNGYLPLDEMCELVSVMDMAMIDVKSYDSKEHMMLTGKDNKTVIENVKYISNINKLYEVRTVIVPDILNNYYNVDMISKLIASLNSNIRYKLIKYRPIGVRTEIIKSYTPDEKTMNGLSELARRNGCENVIVV